MPDYFILNPFKLGEDIHREGTITLTETDAQLLIRSGSLVPVQESVEISVGDQLYQMDMKTSDGLPVSDNELDVMADEQLQADAAARLATEQKDNKKKAKGDAAQS